MAKLSIIIPARNEQFLSHTVNDIFIKSRGDIEVIVILDGYWPDPPLKDYDNLILIHRSQPQGMRPGINSAVRISSGDYLMKTDAHCMFDTNFDRILIEDCEEKWVVVPSRKRLDPEEWCIRNPNRHDINYLYLSFPDNPDDFGGKGLNGKEWTAKNKDPELKKVLIDDLMSAQGSCWFMKKDYFHELELMDAESYGHFWNEMQEIGLKCWLSGGRMVRNKKTWYAHLHKGKTYGRGYFLDKRSLKQGSTYTNKWMRSEAWDKQTKPLSWLIEKFWPVPTWTEEGLELLKSMENSQKFS